MNYVINYNEKNKINSNNLTSFFLTFIFIIIKEKSISKFNLELLVSFSSGLVLEDYKKDISKAYKSNDEKLIY
jgi:hypothetical protein